MDTADQLVMNWRSGLLGLLMAGIVVVLIYLMRRGVEERAVRVLAVLCLAIIVSMVPMLIGFAGAYDIRPGLTFLPTQTMLFFGPLLLIHAQALMTGKSPAWALWMLAPGAAYMLYQLWAFTMLGDFRAKWAFNGTVHEPFVYPAALAITAILLAIAMVQTWRLRRAYLGWLQDNRSDDDAFQPTWIMHLLIIGCAMALVWGAQTALMLIAGVDYRVQYWWDFALLCLTFLTELEALAKLDRPFPKMAVEDRESVAPSPTTPESRDWAVEGNRLKRAMMEQRWYLEPGLSLQSLARLFGTNQTYVSRALNQGLGTGFSLFVNGLRVEHAQRLIEAGDRSMIDIALASGFGSKASFNRAFQTIAGTSPTEYHRRIGES